MMPPGLFWLPQATQETRRPEINPEWTQELYQAEGDKRLFIEFYVFLQEGP